MSNENNLIKFEWKAIVIGLVLVLIGFLIIIVLRPYLGADTALFGFIYLTAACAVVGYISKGHIMNGAIHGGIVGVLVILIIAIYIYFITESFNVLGQLLMLLEVLLIGVISLGIIGGSIGGLVQMIINRNHPVTTDAPEKVDETENKEVAESDAASKTDKNDNEDN